MDKKRPAFVAFLLPRLTPPGWRCEVHAVFETHAALVATSFTAEPHHALATALQKAQERMPDGVFWKPVVAVEAPAWDWPTWEDERFADWLAEQAPECERRWEELRLVLAVAELFGTGR